MCAKHVKVHVYGAVSSCINYCALKGNVLPAPPRRRPPPPPPQQSSNTPSPASPTTSTDTPASGSVMNTTVVTPHTDSAGQPNAVAVQVDSAESVPPSQVNAKQKQENPSANGTTSADGIPPESKQKTGI